MSGLFTTLHGSVKALAAHGRAIETSGRNLANVNNPDYARQRIQYGDRGTVITPHGAQSLGLEALAVQQLRDELLDRQVAREAGLQAMFAAERDALTRAEAGLGQSIDRSQGATATGSNASTGGLAGALDDLFNAFQGLAARPTDSGERQSLLQKATILVDRFQLTDRRLAQAQTDVDIQVAADVTKANRLLATIADLNAQIGRIEIGQPGSAIDLRDQRQARVEELSRLVPVEVREAANGQINLVLRDGAGADVPLVQLATVTGPLAYSGAGLTGGSPATTLDVTSGAIRGSLRARDGAIQTLRTDLDRLARQLVDAVNGAYNPSATAGDNFFDAAGVTAGSIRLAAGLTAGSIRAGTGAAGDNTLALAVAGVAGRRFSTVSGDVVDGTLGEHYARAVSDLGQALSSTEARVADQENIARLVRTQRDSVSGVSLDEELADLVRYQRAFQASSRVFSLVDQLLDTVVNRLGR